MALTVRENGVSNAERRALTLGEKEIVPRSADGYAALPAITGKIELEYEGELIGGHVIARELIRRAANDPSFKQALERSQVVPDYREGAAFAKFFDADYKRMAAVVKSIGKI